MVLVLVLVQRRRWIGEAVEMLRRAMLVVGAHGNVAGNAAQRRQCSAVAVMVHQRGEPVVVGRAGELVMAVHGLRVVWG